MTPEGMIRRKTKQSAIELENLTLTCHLLSTYMCQHLAQGAAWANRNFLSLLANQERQHYSRNFGESSRKKLVEAMLSLALG